MLDLKPIKERQGWLDRGDDMSDHYESLIYDQARSVPALIAEIERLDRCYSDIIAALNVANALLRQYEAAAWPI